MQAWSFDVAVVPARLGLGGTRDISRPPLVAGGGVG